MATDFVLSHESATAAKAIEAANRVEEVVGCFINGDKKALKKMDFQDLAILVQFARDAAGQDEVKVHRKLLQWLAGPETGLSSEAMAYCVLGIQRSDYFDGTEHPIDPSDFNRCLLLVHKVPEVRNYFDKIAALSPQWKTLIEKWDELQTMFVFEVGWNWSKKDCAQKTYDFMQLLLKEGA